jgi:hypothetical protein
MRKVLDISSLNRNLKENNEMGISSWTIPGFINKPRNIKCMAEKTPDDLRKDVAIYKWRWNTNYPTNRLKNKQLHCTLR